MNKHNYDKNENLAKEYNKANLLLDMSPNVFFLHLTVLQKASRAIFQEILGKGNHGIAFLTKIGIKKRAEHMKGLNASTEMGYLFLSSHFFISKLEHSCKHLS